MDCFSLRTRAKAPRLRPKNYGGMGYTEQLCCGEESMQYGQQ